MTGAAAGSKSGGIDNPFNHMNKDSIHSTKLHNLLIKSKEEEEENQSKTSDIFGKQLKQFKTIPGEKVPLIFWLLAGYFRKNPRFFETEGLFRVAAPEADVRELEVHMSQENFYYL